MSTVTSIGLPAGPLTVDDLQALPDDGHRYELLDGTLLVTPAPGWSHQDVVGRLYLLLMRHCVAGLRVLVGPFGVTFGRRDTELQPDLLVARYGDLTAKNLPAAPLLAVEVRSPSTALVDRNLKKAAYARFGVASYWIVDPEAPAITAFELAGEDYVEVGNVTGDGELTLQRPFPVTLRPIEFRRGLDPD